MAKLELHSGSLIVDPWNGSGTTAVACARLKISCQGYDINPVMVHLGRARVASGEEFKKAEELVNAVDGIVGKNGFINLHQVGSLFRELPITNEAAHSIAIAALFPFARSALNLSRTKNPSWYKKNATLSGITLERHSFFSLWKKFIVELAEWQSSPTSLHGVVISIDCGDSRKSLGVRDSFDGFLTSPPYLTRLDYVHATLPELLVLKEFDTVPSIDRLRRSMLGSPLTSKRPDSTLERLPIKVRNLLSRIGGHSSKASATYYYRFFSTYFVDLQASIRSIEKVLRHGASGCMVVQSSNYKEIEINLPDLLICLGEELGLQHSCTYEFSTRRSMSLVNSRAHEAARKPKSEFAVFFRKA